MSPLNGSEAMAISRRGTARPLAELIAEVEQPAGRQRLVEHLAAQPFPHYEPHPERSGLLVRIGADGSRTLGRFVNRVFTPTADA